MIGHLFFVWPSSHIPTLWSIEWYLELAQMHLELVALRSQGLLSRWVRTHRTDLKKMNGDRLDKGSILGSLSYARAHFPSIKSSTDRVKSTRIQSKLSDLRRTIQSVARPSSNMCCKRTIFACIPYPAWIVWVPPPSLPPILADVTPPGSEKKAATMLAEFWWFVRTWLVCLRSRKDLALNCSALICRLEKFSS